MKIPWKELNPDTLRSIIEEFASRDGTDYGHTEAPLGGKVLTIMKLLEQGKAALVYDPETQTCNITEVLPSESRLNEL
jgi:uncharacterized protein YheU (UPF0270 family)